VTGAVWTFTAIAAGCAAFLFWALPVACRDVRDTWRSRRPLPPWTPPAPAQDAAPVPSPAHDAVPLGDDEEYAFAGLVLGYFQREDAQ